MWRKFRDQRTSGRAEALFRIAFAAVLLVQLLTLRANVDYFYSTEGLSPPPPGFEAYYAPALVQVCFWCWFASAVLLLFGAFTRVAAAVCFLGCFYFLVLRGPQATHAADWLLPSLAFQLALLPSNRHYALDQRLRQRKLLPDVPAWPLRLAQLSTAFFYFTAGTSKLMDPMWRRGAGFFMTFANPMLSHFDLTKIAGLPVVSPAINYAVMVWECAMPLLLLWRRTRWLALVSAALFLASIDVTLPVGWFAWFCIANLFVFADVTQWPRAWRERLPWLAVPIPPSAASPSLPRERAWKHRAVTAFLAFHLTSFGVLQAAYLCLAAQRYDWGRRIAALPVLGAYGYAIANVRYYALWPSQIFCPIHYVYFEADQADGRMLTLPPFDNHGRAHISWSTSREVREGVFLMTASHGLGSLGWRRLFTHVAEAERQRAASGQCPQELRAYAVEIWPGPGSFDRDLRRGRQFLQRAELAPAAAAGRCQVKLLADRPRDTHGSASELVQPQ
jgi:Vitamin K-dependent gamma-carboxylase